MFDLSGCFNFNNWNGRFFPLIRQHLSLHSTTMHLHLSGRAMSGWRRSSKEFCGSQCQEAMQGAQCCLTEKNQLELQMLIILPRRRVETLPNCSLKQSNMWQSRNIEISQTPNGIIPFHNFCNKPDWQHEANRQTRNLVTTSHIKLSHDATPDFNRVGSDDYLKTSDVTHTQPDNHDLEKSTFNCRSIIISLTQNSVLKLQLC